MTEMFSVLGISLWDKGDINKDLDVKPQPLTSFNVVTSDSLNEKTKLMDISASVKASFMAGLVEVGGSGSYLNDKSSSMRQCRATMKYKQTTVFKQLTMTQLGEVMYRDVFKQKNATHVVTAALYGVEAYMVFDQMASSEEEKQDIRGNLDLSINKIPKVDINSSGKLVLTDEEKKRVEKFSCTFYGDIALEQNPSTYEEAVLLYKKLPQLVGDGSKAVPVNVWLYPLKNLNSTAAQLVREIGLELVGLLEVRIDQLHEAEIRANDTISRGQAIKVTDITDNLVKFRNGFAVYTDNFRKNISSILPVIRNGTEEEEKLVNILKFHHESSFAYDKMRKWLDDKETEIGVLEKYINLLEDCEIVPPGPELKNILFDPNQRYVYIFNFTSLKKDEPYLSNLFECLASGEFRNMQNISVAQELSFKEKAQPWFSDPEISDKMRDVLASFQSKITTSKLLVLVQSAGKFIISYTSDPSCQGASFHTYKNGKLQHKTN